MTITPVVIAPDRKIACLEGFSRRFAPRLLRALGSHGAVTIDVNVVCVPEVPGKPLKLGPWTMIIDGPILYLSFHPVQLEGQCGRARTSNLCCAERA